MILLGVSLYGLYQYYEQKEYLAQKVLEGASLDPLVCPAPPGAPAMLFSMALLSFQTSCSTRSAPSA